MPSPRNLSVGEALEDLVEQAHHFGGVHGFRHGGEAGEVGEEHADLALLGRHGELGGLRVPDDALHHRGRAVARQPGADLPLVAQVVAQSSLLHGHCRQDRQDGEGLQVLGLEWARGRVAIDVDEADHPAIAVERRAHGRVDPHHDDALGAVEAAVCLGVLDQQ